MQNRYPTPEELYAYERAAREARSAEIARLMQALFRHLKRAFGAGHAKGLRHA